MKAETMTATAPTTDRTLPSEGLWSLRRFVSVSLALLLATGGAVAQDNDDDGVLPGKGGKSGMGGTGGQQAATAAPAVDLVVAGEVVDAVIDGTRALVAVDVTGDLVVVPPNEADQADVDTKGMALPVEMIDDGTGSLRFQGEADVVLPDGAAATAHAAPAASLTMAAIMVDDGSVPVDDYLDGQAVPPVLDVLGDVPSLDLRHFRELVSHYGEDYPGLYVTWVFASTDAQGALQLLAVRARTDGTDLEIRVR